MRTNVDEFLQNLPILPALLQTAILALLTTSIPLAKIMTSALIAVVDHASTLLSDPLPAQMKDVLSIHVFAFSSLGELLVVESEGDFTFDVWQRAHDKALHLCRGSQMGKDEKKSGEEDVDMDIESPAGSSKEDLLRTVIQEKALRDQRWKQSPD